MSINTKDWKTMKLGDILTEEQIDTTIEILKCRFGIDNHDRLREYYCTFREQLEAKGILPEFLAHAVPFWIKKGKQDEAKLSRN